MVSSNNSEQEIPLTSQYKLYPNRKLGSGAFGEIYYGMNNCILPFRN